MGSKSRELKCLKCGKIFSQKSNYTRHINRKFQCNKITTKQDEEIHNNSTKTDVNPPDFVENFSSAPFDDSPILDIPILQVIPNVDKLTCPNCGKKFVRTDVRAKHCLSSCPVQKQYHISMEKLLQKMIDKIKTLQTENVQLKMSKISNTTNNNTTNNNTTYNILNVNNISDFKLVAYGKEDMSFITPANYDKIFKRGRNAVIEFVQFLHFNTSHPENHNIYISNIRDDYALIFDGTRWMLQQRNKVLDDMYIDSVSALDDKYYERKKNNSDLIVTKFEQFLEKRTDDKVVNDIKAELKLLIYNYRYMVEDARKRLEIDEPKIPKLI